MTAEDKLRDALESHPCYNEKAHREFARMHLPIAPRCNIQCNYCNRKYDCSNESRPGVTSEVLTPQEAAEKVAYVKERIPNLSVIGIAGPGDPLANEETFETLAILKDRFPDLTLCVSTNGLKLPENAQRLYDLGVRFITVTMNACDPKIGAKIYSHVILDGKRYDGEEGAKILEDRQSEGIRKCAELGMLVKINIVMVPGINTDHIPTLVKAVKKYGAYIVNILPLIPVEGTKFENMCAPTAEERKELMDNCSLDAKIMRHCRQCRADAIGMLDNDRSGEFAHFGSCRAACGPMADPTSMVTIDRDADKVAVATSDGISVDSGFGNSKRFDVYVKKNDEYAFSKTIFINTDFQVSGRDHRSHLQSVVERLEDCGTVIVGEIGPLPEKLLRSEKVSVSIFNGKVEDALRAL